MSPNVLLCIHKFSDTSLNVYAVVMEMPLSQRGVLRAQRKGSFLCKEKQSRTWLIVITLIPKLSLFPDYLSPPLAATSQRNPEQHTGLGPSLCFSRNSQAYPSPTPPGRYLEGALVS